MVTEDVAGHKWQCQQVDDLACADERHQSTDVGSEVEGFGVGRTGDQVHAQQVMESDDEHAAGTGAEEAVIEANGQAGQRDHGEQHAR